VDFGTHHPSITTDAVIMLYRKCVWRTVFFLTAVLAFSPMHRIAAAQCGSDSYRRAGRMCRMAGASMSYPQKTRIARMKAFA